MPYIKLKVCQDLYCELGLSPIMELVRSSSGASIKFVPLPDKSVFDDYESPLLTSPMFGNRDQDSGNPNSSVLVGEFSHENVTSCTSDVPCEEEPPNNPSEGGNTTETVVLEERTDLNQPVLLEDEVQLHMDKDLSPDSSMNMCVEEIAAIDKRDTFQKDNQTVNMSPLAGKNSHSQSITKVFKTVLLEPSYMQNFQVDNVRCIELNSRGHMSSVSVTATSPPPSRINPRVCKVCSKRYTSAVSFSRHLRNCDTGIKYPRKCENCLSVYKHPSSFTRHKKSCDEAKRNALARTTLKSDGDSKTLQQMPHLKEGEKYCENQTISSNSEGMIIPPPGEVSSNNDLSLNCEAKYIPLKENSEFCRFFIRKEAPANSGT